MMVQTMDVMTAEFSLDGLSPQTVYAPRDAGELANVLAECNAEGRAVIPWGGGTLQHLGNLPTRLDAVIATRGLNQVVDYAYDDLTATFGAGMTLAEIAAVLDEHGQFLPIDVPHPEQATIGGVLAAGANGPLRLRYGPPRDFMIGNRFATVDGKIIKAGSKVVKNVAGYELHKVQVGALGTLGIITEATFKLFPKPPAEMSVWAAFDELKDACAAVPQIWNLATPPLAIELVDAAGAGVIQPGVGGAWHVAARFGGTTATMAAARDLSIGAAKENHAHFAEKVEDTNALWRAIEDYPATLRMEARDALLVRVSVPPKELATMLGVLLNFPTRPRILAHAALATIYVAFEGETAALEALVAQLRLQIHELHGHVLVEGAPESLRKSLDVWSEVGASFKMMRALKDKFDPKHVLNPGRFVGGI